MIGKSFIHYEITAEIGRGGMGEVYQAKDTKLGRNVAIKVLPEEFALDADRVARFQREAKLLAALNHPNIAAIYGLEESEGTHFLVLELIEGETLSNRLKRGPIPVEEALKLALQMAEALEAAHEKGVIHRDLKPANIKVTPDGKVKVLDFGLAKAYAGDQENISPLDSPTISAAATQQGVILGTAAYMSPEQARGETVDKKADIWAFGVVLFEMLTGRQVFTGRTVSDTLASVLAREPEWNGLPPNLHSRIRFLLERCLEKEARDRYSGISDARVEIQKVLVDPGGVFAQSLTTTEPQTRSQSIIPWIVSILGILIVGVAVWYLKPTPTPEPREVTRFEYVLPGEQPLLFAGPMLSISPDGSQLVYCTRDGLCLRSMNEFHARFISGTDANSQQPFFSLDGRWIGYWSANEQQLKKIAISGGTPVTLCEATVPFGPSWIIDDTIVYVQAEGIMGVSARGGIPEVIVASKGDSFFEPTILPDGKLVLFTIIDENERKIAVQSLESGERKILVPGTNGTYLRTGHLVYSREGNLYAVPFDLETLEPASSGPVLMAEGISSQRGAETGQYVVSDSGTLVYIPGGSAQTESRILARVDRDGHVNRLNAPPKAYVSPRISPDGTKLAIQSLGDDSVSTLWIYDLTDDREIRQLTLEGSNCRPIWTPDSKRITFSSDHEGAMSIYWMPADGSSGGERLTTAEDGTRHLPDSWSHDGETLAYTVERTYNTDCDICFISPGGEPECLYDRQNTIYMGAQFSPDGRWIAYFSGPEVGQGDVYVERFPPTGLPNQITYGGGRGVWPMWSTDGEELFYRPSTSSGQPIALKAVDITMDPEFSFRNDRTLPIESFSTVPYYRGYDITPDGAEFLMTFPADSAESPRSEKINIVVNWFEELKERVPVD